MRKFKEGDKVRVTNNESGNAEMSTEEFVYKVGDIGKFDHIDSDGDLWINFNDQDNLEVCQDGIWCVSEDELEHVT